MQLIPSHGGESRPAATGVRAGLAAATWVLLGCCPGSARAGQIEGSNLVYVEPNRITAVETAVEGSKELSNGGSLLLKVVFDALTGASANGAVPSESVQTFTRPSGQGVYSVRPGEAPVDPTFEDTRVAGSALWTHPLGRLTSSNVGVHASSETDYLSLGISAGISRDFAMRNTTVAAGFSMDHDTIRPLGGVPVPFAPMAPPSGGNGENDDDDEGERGGPGKGKNVVDFLLGVTQVLDRATVARVNYTLGFSSGYQTDPYKLLSVIQGPGESGPGNPVEYLYERRPDRRTKHALYGEVRRRIGADALAASYRRYWDSWGIRSSTVDLHLAHPVGQRLSLEPHYRYYRQHKADFYTHYLVSGDSLPDHASADYRLGTFTASTYGMEGRYRLDSGAVIRFGLEYYLQRGDSSPPEAYGALVGQDLFPDIGAWMLRLGGTVPVKW